MYRIDKTQALTIAGTDTYTVTATTTMSSYITGEAILCIFTNANTGAATLNVNSLGAKAIQKNGGTALAASDINAGQPFWLVYDGTDYQLVGTV